MNPQIKELKEKNGRFAYVARYPLNESKTDWTEEILMVDTHWTEKLDSYFDELSRNRTPDSPMIQGWYSDRGQVICMASTRQQHPLP